MIPALVFVVILGALAIFQVAAACGAPLGRFVWGGQHDTLPRHLRTGSALAPVIYLVLAIPVLDRADVIDILPDAVATVGTWIAFGFMALSIAPNAISRSRAERYTMTPIVVVLAITSLLVALG